MDTKKIKIVDDKGNIKEVAFITILTLDKYNSSYLVYCENEITDGQNELSIAKMNEENGEMYLENITSKEEFDDVFKEINKELSE